MSIEDFYLLRDVLGKGSFSTVHLAESRYENGGYAAVKKISKVHKESEDDVEEDVTDMIDKEIRIMSLLDHPNIVHLEEVYEEVDYVCLVLELAQGGEVYDRVIERGALPERLVIQILIQLICALRYIHEMGIVHRDLKLENLLFYDDQEDSKIVVADFGLSEWVSNLVDKASNVCGTPGYMAPETIRDRKYSEASDMWSVGVIAYILVAGYPPFALGDSDDDAVVLKNIVKGKYVFYEDEWNLVSPEAKDFVKRLMCRNPRKRLRADEALAHPWFLPKFDISTYGRLLKSSGCSCVCRSAFCAMCLSMSFVVSILWTVHCRPGYPCNIIPKLGLTFSPSF